MRRLLRHASGERLGLEGVGAILILKTLLLLANFRKAISG
jgi:hypothetical protein